MNPEKFLKFLINSDPKNQKCVDCNRKPVLYACWNLGGYICTPCSGVHRSLGVHISKVKSLTLDKWTPEQIKFIAERGNGWVNEVYARNMPNMLNLPKSSQNVPKCGKIRKNDFVVLDDVKRKRIISEKYEQKRWMAFDDLPELADFETVVRDFTRKCDSENEVLEKNRQKKLAAVKFPSMNFVGFASKSVDDDEEFTDFASFQADFGNSDVNDGGFDAKFDTKPDKPEIGFEVDWSAFEEKSKNYKNEIKNTITPEIGKISQYSTDNFKFEGPSVFDQQNTDFSNDTKVTNKPINWNN